MVNSKLLLSIVSNIAKALYMFLLSGASHFKMDIILDKHISNVMIIQKLSRNCRTIKKRFFIFKWTENLSPDVLRVGGKRRD